MIQVRPRTLLSCACAALVLALWALLALPGVARSDFEIGLQDDGLEMPATSPASQFAYRALQAIHGTTVRLELVWRAVAPPDGLVSRLGFNPSDPADPRYNWDGIDAEVENAAAHGARVILEVDSAPPWAQLSARPASMSNYPGSWDPDPLQFADFVRAAAERYGGTFPDPAHPGAFLPRVSDWEIWNEENLPYALGAPNLVEEYRSLLNAAYNAIKAIHPDNVVATGGLAPVSFLPPLSISPLAFGAQLMCLQRAGSTFVRSQSCPTPAHFDVFADHPYTVSATPTKPANNYDDVLIGDMGKIGALVHAGDTLGSVQPAIQHPIWVTEWAWFTNPPDPQVGDPPPVAARYVADSMYEMWRAGVSLVIWFDAQDPPMTGQNSPAFFFGGGLYSSAGQPKLTLRAFAFPFVAGVNRRRGFAWGRAPVSRRARVIVQRRVRRRWRRVGRARTGTDGVFYLGFRARGNGTYRAVVIHGPTSLPYNSKPIAPRQTHAFYSG